jgi:hypothetical protein
MIQPTCNVCVCVCVYIVILLSRMCQKYHLGLETNQPNCENGSSYAEQQQRYVINEHTQGYVGYFASSSVDCTPEYSICYSFMNKMLIMECNLYPLPNVLFTIAIK